MYEVKGDGGEDIYILNLWEGKLIWFIDGLDVEECRREFVIFFKKFC